MNLGESMDLGHYSLGIGDRFGQQGRAQLAALIEAKEQGVTITPVWNKSFREHQIIGTHPNDVRQEADAACRELGWTASYFVDADHVNGETVDLFLPSSDFFTIDIADEIDRTPEDSQMNAFLRRFAPYVGDLRIPGIDQPFRVDREALKSIAAHYLSAIMEAGRIYRHIVHEKQDEFVVEVSMDETDSPQTPVELFFILGAVADAAIPARTFAPKFSGSFNKGVDYVGDVDLFALEFEQDLHVVNHAVEQFNLPKDLKLSVHSGSDKFILYPRIRGCLKTQGAGLHLKTAGTTWLEELIGLAEAGGDGLGMSKAIYRKAYQRIEAISAPYATVIDIEKEQLPSPDTVDTWDSEAYTSRLRHDPNDDRYNKHVRQLLHIGYQIAAEMGDRYLRALKAHEESIAKNVTLNLFERHIKPLFL